MSYVSVISFMEESDLLSFNFQVYLDANEICGKTLSMASDRFKEEFCRSLKNLYNIGELTSMVNIWSGRHTDLRETFGIEDAQQAS